MAHVILVECMSLHTSYATSRRAIRRWYALVLANLALSCYNVAIIWTMQLDVFSSWRYIPSNLFGQVQGQHFLKLFIIVFPQALLTTILAGLLLKQRPKAIARWPLRLAFVLQLLLWLLTAIFWGRWQGQIATLPPGASAPMLGPANHRLYQTLLTTHWLRVGMITLYALIAAWLARRTFLPPARSSDVEEMCA